MISLSQSAFLQALGWAIANSLWQMALLWGLYQLCFGLFRAVKASIKTTAATVLLFTGFLWFLGSMINHYWYLTSESARRKDGTLSGYTTTLRDYPGHTLLFYVNKALGWSEHYLPYLSFAYLLVLGFLLVRVVKAYQQVREIRTEGLTKMEARWRVYVQEMAYRIGIPKNIKVWLSDKIDIPATVGYLKPLILLPIATFNHLTTEQVEAILLHELAHINRNDYLLNLVITVVETILFFNPFAQLISRHLKTERENSCDDFVLQFRYNPHVYASALLSLVQQRSAPELAMAASGRTDLLDRVKRIMNVPARPMNYGQKLMALLITACILVSLAWLSPETIAHKASEPTPVVTLSPGDRRLFIDTVAHVYAKSRPIHTRSVAPVPSHPKPRPVIAEDIHADLPPTDDQEIAEGQNNNLIFKKLALVDSAVKVCAASVNKQVKLVKLQRDQIRLATDNWKKDSLVVLSKMGANQNAWNRLYADQLHQQSELKRVQGALNRLNLMKAQARAENDREDFQDLDSANLPSGTVKVLPKKAFRSRRQPEQYRSDYPGATVDQPGLPDQVMQRFQTPDVQQWKNIPVSFCIVPSANANFKERVVMVRPMKKASGSRRDIESSAQDMSCSSVDQLLQELEGDGKVTAAADTRIEKDNNILIINGKVQDQDIYSRYRSYFNGQSVLIVTSGKVVQITIK
jgi:Zn-dependent protease with chaperone function